MVGCAVTLLVASVGRAEEWAASPPLAPAVAAARSAHELVLIEVGTRWCPSCRKLDAVLEDGRVRRALPGYVRLRYDAEEGEGKDVAERYNAIAFPTLLVVGGDGRELGRVTGDLPAAELLVALDKIKSGVETLARLEQQAAKRPDDLTLRLRVGTEWALRGSRARACANLDAVLGADPHTQRGLAAPALLAKGKVLLLRSLHDNAAAAVTLAELRTRFPSAPEADAAVFSLAQALHRSGKRQQALKLLEDRATTGEQHDEVAWFCLRERTAYRRGLAHAERAVALAPEQASYWASLAELQLRAGQPAKAEASWRRARGLDPASPRTRGPLAPPIPELTTR